MNTFQKIKAGFDRSRTDRLIDTWCQERGMQLNGEWGFTIKPAGLVREFNYLLKHYSNGRLDDFDGTDFMTLAAHRADVVARALNDRANPREHQNLGIGLSLAQRNIDCLVAIMDTIADYTVLCESHGREDRVSQGRHYGRA